MRLLLPILVKQDEWVVDDFQRYLPEILPLSSQERIFFSLSVILLTNRLKTILSGGQPPQIGEWQHYH